MNRDQKCTDLCEIARRFNWVPENSEVEAVGALTLRIDPETNRSIPHLNCDRTCP